MTNTAFDIEHSWLRNLFEKSSDPTWIIEGNRFVECNNAALGTLGYSNREEFLKLHPSELSPPKQPDGEDSFDKAERMMTIAMDKGLHRFEWIHTKADDRELTVEVTLSVIEVQNKKFVYCVWRDIDACKHMEQTLVRQKDIYAALSHVNQAIVQCDRREELFSAICRAAVEHGHFAFACIGLMIDGHLTPVSSYTKDTDPAIKAILTADKSSPFLGCSLTAQTFRSGKHRYSNDLLYHQLSIPWCAAARQAGVVAMGSYPVRQGGAVIGVMNFYSRESGYFTEELSATLDEMAMDVAFALDRLECLAKGNDVVSEMRDSCAPGHERRVGEISYAIGAELGLDHGRLEGLKVAGFLHDIGLVTISAEILSNPGKLTPIELRQIKEHAQAGYDVLKDVEFPWPVAQVALQHHERMDGSGYPQGLKGEAILLESRIIAVADVVDAMSSHRPYRAAPGIETALAEIERGSGSAYDPGVAKACLQLFRNKGCTPPA